MDWDIGRMLIGDRLIYYTPKGPSSSLWRTMALAGAWNVTRIKRLTVSTGDN